MITAITNSRRHIAITSNLCVVKTVKFFCAYYRKNQCPRDVATEISVWSYMVQGFALFDKCGLDWFLKSFAEIFEVINFSWQPLCIPIEKAKRDFDATLEFGKVRFGLARLGLIQTLPM